MMDISYYKKYEPLFGAWRIVREIGSGSFGKVFEIEREDFGPKYRAALKAITIPQNPAEVESIMDDGMDAQSVTSYFRGFVDELLEEFRIMSKLKGESNVVSCEDYTVIQHNDGIGWDILIRMELLTPLLKYTRSHPFGREDVIKLGIDICRALELCRNQNIIHRDIKPENIFVSDSGKFKLGDFGIARTVEKTSGGLSKKGTYTYMAPEVYKGEAYGPGVDIYSLGIVLYRYVNGNRAPFLPPAPTPITHSERSEAMDRRIKGERLPAPSDADPALAKVILKACAYNPRARYSSPAEMRKALEALLTTQNAAVAADSAMSTILLDKKNSSGSFTTVKDENLGKQSRAVPEKKSEPQVRFVEKKPHSKKLLVALCALLAAGLACFCIFFLNRGPGEVTDWTEWSQELPSGVDKSKYEVEEQTRYRYRTKETTTSTTESELDGWESSGVTEAGSKGTWSAWSADPVEESDTRKIETQTRYRYRELKTTTGSSKEKSGWELYNTTYKNDGYGSWSSWSTNSVSSSSTRDVETKTQYSYRTVSYSTAYTDWGSWSGWSRLSVSSSNTCDVQTRTVYMYCYFQCSKCGAHWHGYGFPCYTWGGGCGSSNTITEGSYHEVWGTTPQSQMGFQDWHGTGHTYAYYNGELVFRNINTPNASATEYRYRTRSTKSVPSYSSWSDYSDSYQSSNSSKEVRTRTVYRYRDIQQVPVYHFKKWGDWSGWSTSTVSATAERDVESKMFYRYYDIPQEKTYNFHRWSDWSEWSDTAIESSEDTEVQTETFYRYRSKQ